MKKITLAIAAIALTVSTLAAEVNLKSCAGCHGSDWSKKALGKSADVSKMSETDIESALIGYKDGTYGGAMKGLMKGQVAKYSNEELTASAKVILGAK